MEQPAPFNRRLAAIAFADVAGWSIQIERDDISTLRAWKALRAEVIEPLIREHNGRLLEIQGDAVLIEFPSAVAAVNWAVGAQQGAAGIALRDDRVGLKLRIGVNVEDVIVDEGKLIGDGVNIAARIHQAAAAGEIVATENVRDFVRNKASVSFVDLGTHDLKNISRKIRVFRVDAAAEVATFPREAQPSLSWATRPAVAVLPFRTLGGDAAADAYFGEGITEDIINAMSRSHSFYVISRNSTLRYRDVQVDLREVAKDLGVRYLLQGSVRRIAPRLRITCELIDATSLSAIWSEKFDGADSDIFNFQDQIAASVVGKLEPRLLRVETDRALQKPTEHLGAYDCVLRAISTVYTFDDRQFADAGAYLKRAIKLDPTYAQAHAWLAWWYNLAAGEGRSTNREGDGISAQRAAMTGVALDPEDAFCVAVAAHVQAFLGSQLDDAAEMFDRAVLLNQNSAFAWGLSAPTYCYLGRPDAAMERLRNAWRLSPFDSLNFLHWTVAGIAEFVAGRYDESIAWLRKSQRANARFVPCHRTLAVSLALSGDEIAAKQAAANLLLIEPAFRISTFVNWYPLRDAGHRARLMDGLHIAGLPE